MAFAECFSHTCQKRSMPFWLERSYNRRTDGIFGHCYSDGHRETSSQLYWSQDSRLHRQGVTRIFPRDRFDYILKYFYCTDPENIPHKDDPDYKLYRVKPVLEELSKKFLELYDPQRSSLMKRW